MWQNEEEKELVNALQKSVDLVLLYNQFEYPFSLKISKYIGQIGWHQNKLSLLDIFYLWFQKIYNNLINAPRSSQDSNKNLIFNFLMQDKAKFEKDIQDLIEHAKSWDQNGISDEDFSIFLDEFCENHKGFQMRTLSFVLRMLLPKRFATIDVRVTKALKKLGFNRKVLEFNDHVNYSGKEYLEYIKLLAEIGKKYKFLDEGTPRRMYPGEVDIALYVFDKKNEKSIKIKSLEFQQISSIQELNAKYANEMFIALNKNLIEVIRQEFLKDKRVTRSEKNQIKRSVQTLEFKLNQFKNQSDIEGMYDYIVRLSSQKQSYLPGVKARKILQNWGYPSVESIKRKYLDKLYKEYSLQIKKVQNSDK
ncbi:MAG: hypothetical protein ACTSRG_19850 [Candidatus Helarchaeota archaeon]